MAPPLPSEAKTRHIILFPFMSKGHTIPLLHLAHLLLQRGVAVTIFTTPGNHPFISRSLAGADVTITDLPFPPDIPGIPTGVENTEKLPSMSLFVSFVNGIKRMQPSLEEELRKIHPTVSCIVSDAFLPWTLESASRFGIPRLSFYGMSHYAGAVSSEVIANGLLWLHESADEPFTLTRFPWVKLTRNDFDEPFNRRDLSGPHFDFVVEAIVSTANSFGLLVNSFYELEPVYADYVSGESQPKKTWTVGPLCLAKPRRTDQKPAKWIDWLDRKLAQNSSVLYVAFGSQAKISSTQLREIAIGLEESKVSFLWVVKNSKAELIDGFEEKVRERGMIVDEWVDQEEILEHSIVRGFLSHCGWNSVLEGICAGVPILAWPMMADQFINAKAVVEELGVGLRVITEDGSSKGFVTAAGLKESVVELIDGEKGKVLSEKVKEAAAAARKAVAEGGSSWSDLNNLIHEAYREKEINGSKLNLQARLDWA